MKSPDPAPGKTSDRAISPESSKDAIPTGKIFICQECGECCRGFGGTYVYEVDIQKLADFLGISPEEFAASCLEPSGSKKVIRQKEDGFCVFHKDKRCGVHPVKPRMCRAWPFIKAVVEDPANWRIMAGSCPGMKADADPDLVVEIVSKMLASKKK